MPEPLRSTLERFTAASRDDDRVVAAFLGGSFAADRADDHSDLDLYVVVAAEAWSSFFADRRAFLGRLGKPILAEDFDQYGFDMLLFQLADGTPGELALAPTSGFVHMHGGPFTRLLDKTGILDGVEFPLFRPETGDPKVAAREHLVFFWRNLSKLPAALGRDRLFVAFSCLDLSRKRLLNLVELAASPAEAPSGYDGFHALGDDAAVLERALAPTFAGLEPESLLRAGRTLAEVMAERGPALAERLGAAYPAAYAAYVRNLLARTVAEA